MAVSTAPDPHGIISGRVVTHSRIRDHRNVSTAAVLGINSPTIVVYEDNRVEIDKTLTHLIFYWSVMSLGFSFCLPMRGRISRKNKLEVGGRQEFSQGWLDFIPGAKRNYA